MRSDPFGGCYRGKSVWLSGHTGFKGSWLASWLLELGARVHGFAQPPPTNPSVFEQLGLAGRMQHEIGDVREAAAVRRSIVAVQPDFVFHLAAQPLVRASYLQPVDTYETNVMGTMHVLDALRSLEKPCAAVMVTTDKCYENREWVYGYREDDALGGHDPYSSSKAAAEIAIASMRRSFFKDHPVRIASARAGNVIGGGDWAQDRIVPDCIRALQAGQPIRVRNPYATRPWQHVLEPLSGYLWLAAKLSQPSTLNPQLSSAFNFGPRHDANRSVGELVAEVLKHWPGRWEDQSDPKAVHEAGLLQLSIDKAHALLRWLPVWNFSQGVKHTVEWYCGVKQEQDSAAIWQVTSAQIARYVGDACASGAPWAETNSWC
ncbi:MAG: CDP-glucose 4,6-dehydratase [Verrucomicrobia bacterium]|nr:CDP-glucose 4,6-dehydratase [Verrucomicrobiota bacterium]